MVVALAIQEASEQESKACVDCTVRLLLKTEEDSDNGLELPLKRDMLIQNTRVQQRPVG